MPELTNEATRTAAILQQIADKVAPLTRFGRSSFTATGIETIGAIITAEMRYTVSFSRINDAGYGGLPSGTFTVPGDRALDSHIQKLRQTAEHELPQRLERWAAAQPAPPGPPTRGEGLLRRESAGWLLLQLQRVWWEGTRDLRNL